MRIQVPIFTKNDHEFFILHDEFKSQNEVEAHKIGFGTMFVEGLLLGFKFTNRVMELPEEGIAHAAAIIGPYHVAIISGPIFEEAKELDYVSRNGYSKKH